MAENHEVESWEDLDVNDVSFIYFIYINICVKKFNIFLIIYELLYFYLK